MTGLWIGLSKLKEYNDIKKTLNYYFINYLIINETELDLIQNNNKYFLINVCQNNSEFPTLISFNYIPGEQNESSVMKIMIELAELFGKEYDCDTICDGSGYGDIKNYPYYSIIYKHKKFYLADDSNTKFADGSDGFVKIIKELKINRMNSILEKYKK